MKHLIVFLSVIIFFGGCENSTEPDSGQLRLLLKADKTSGTAPLTVKFSGEIRGNTEGIAGMVPDYFLMPVTFLTIIPITIPDSTQPFASTWHLEKTYQNAGEGKVYLIYQGVKDGERILLVSDTLTINVE